MADKNALLKYTVIILVIVMIDLVAGFFIARKILNYAYNTNNVTEVSGTGEQSTEESTNQPEPPGTMVPLEPINLNPSQSNGEIFSCDIVLEAKDPLVITELGVRNPQIMDKISGYLSLKTVQELSDAKQWDQYRKEMIDLVNSVLTNGKITNLYIKQKIIQFP
jgi:flagellar basal body-associated protein FliL